MHFRATFFFKVTSGGTTGTNPDNHEELGASLKDEKILDKRIDNSLTKR